MWPSGLRSMPIQIMPGAARAEPCSVSGTLIHEAAPATATVVVIMKKISKTRLMSMSGIISTSSSSSARRRLQVKSISTGSRASAWSSARYGIFAGQVGGQGGRVAEAEPFFGAGGPEHVVFQEPALLRPVGDDGEWHLFVDRVAFDDPDIKEAAFFGHGGLISRRAACGFTKRKRKRGIVSVVTAAGAGAGFGAAPAVSPPAPGRATSGRRLSS